MRYSELYDVAVAPDNKPRHPPGLSTSNVNAYRLAVRHDAAAQTEADTASWLKNVSDNWPQVVSLQDALDCCSDYYHATTYHEPDLCAVCSRRQSEVKMHSIRVSRLPHSELSGLEVLSLSEYRFRESVPESEFLHPNKNLSGLMLDHNAIRYCIDESGTADMVAVCHDCYLAFERKGGPYIPRFSLRNNLYRGSLPDHLKDLTWVEEMVCARYRITAHVTRLYQSHNPRDPIAKKLVSVSPDLIRSVADHLENEGSISSLSPEQKEVLTLLTKVNTIAAHIPGSQASKLQDRNAMRAFMGFFGIGHIYLTMNPSATHSPIFQVFFGDKEVDLGSRYPQLAPASERALRLAADPVAGADFFDFCIKKFMQHLLGWDFSTSRPTQCGGILGHIKAFFGTAEYYERGSLHCHFVIWLLGGLNPTELHQKLAKSEEFQKRFFDFFEDIIKHHLPDIDIVPEPGYEPRVQRPPLPTDYKDNPVEWASVFESEVKLIGEILQSHFCRSVCHKFNHVDACRFRFPHPVVLKSYFDEKTNSVVLLCLDGNINYHNPYILVFCRHNHDIKCIFSGAAAKAAMFYITDYITKMDISLHEMISLLSRTIHQENPT